MAVSIIEALRNCERLIANARTIPKVLEIAKQQLHNVITLLEKGYSIYEEVDPLLEKYGKVEDVPELV